MQMISPLSALGACLLSVTLFSACVNTGRYSLPGQSVHVPVRLVSNLPFAQVRLEGRPYTFLVDTGASDCVVTPSLARQLGLTISREKALVKSAAGDHVLLPTTTIPSLQIGEAEFRNFPAFIYDCKEFRGMLSGMDGVIGFSLFRDSLLTLDYPRQQLVISPWKPLSATGQNIVAMETHSGVPRLPLMGGGHTLFIDIDSGSTGGLELNLQKFPMPVTAPPRPGALSTSISGTYRAGMARLSQPVFLGPVQLDQPIVEVSRGDSRVGGEVLRNLVITFDQRSKLARLSFGKMEQLMFFKADRRLVSPSRIGTGIGFDSDWVVRDVVPGSPAAQKGIRAGDRCLTIQGRPAAAWEGTYADLLRESSLVNYTFSRQGRHFEASIPVVLQVR